MNGAIVLRLVSRRKTVVESPNERYLLLDLARPACKNVARPIEEETEGRITACSLQDPEVQ